MFSLCNDWEFAPAWTDGFLKGEGRFEKVRLPHNIRDISLHYAGPEDYEGICGYRQSIFVDAKSKGKRLFLQFDGAAHIAYVYVNGRLAAEHHTGYTAFRAEITDLVEYGKSNLVAVKLDTTENPSTPPFGFVIDYLTYSGLYREAWLDIREQSFISDVFVSTPDLNTARAQISIDPGKTAGRTFNIIASVLDGGKTLASASAVLSEEGGDLHESTVEIPCEDALPWSVDSPKLYTLKAELAAEDGSVLDVQTASFGFRTAVFKADGFYLNGQKLFIRGLDRHQNFPYVGYAAPKHLQEEDARILKEELACNAVRTSHYPQSHWFINACDRLGLLVFTEIPGWQHIGGEEWKDQAVKNTEEMVLQYRNHPSIVLWGVRINESQDCDDLYVRTNEVAHRLDPTRQTSGVRYIENSHLLEDVYAYNDFSHDGFTPGCKPKKKVMKEADKPLLISEANGHMFPTKSFDSWAKRQAHALRHARVLGDAMADGQHCGCFQWCMFDYPTHKDFGSGDRVCYHGVMDAFRNPKLAASIYASQGEETPVLEISSPMDIGDYPGGNVGEIYAFTNADEVQLYKNNVYVTTFKPKAFGALKHPPVPVDDLVGELLKTQEGFDEKKAEVLGKCLSDLQKYGMANLPLGSKLRFGWAMFKYKLKYEDGVALYGKYIGNWGGESTVWRFDAVKDGKVIRSVSKCPSRRLHIEAKPSRTSLVEEDTYDMAAVRIRILDENNNPAVYAQIPAELKAEGCIELVGPSVVTLEGGMAGTYVRTTGKEGSGKLTVSTAQTKAVEIVYSVRRKQI